MSARNKYNLHRTASFKCSHVIQCNLHVVYHNIQVDECNQVTHFMPSSVINKM